MKGAPHAACGVPGHGIEIPNGASIHVSIQNSKMD